MKRKIVQISVITRIFTDDNSYVKTIIALADDGTLWEIEDSGQYEDDWIKIQKLPDTEEDDE